MASPDQVPLVYPVGHHACGKSKVSEYLIDTYGFAIIETGAMVRAAYAEADPDRTKFGHIGEFASEAEADDPNFFIDMILTDVHRKMLHTEPSGIIINGMRTLAHLRRLQASTSGNPQAVVWIESPRDALKERWEAREGHALTEEEFDALLRFDSSLGLDDIRPAAHAEIANDGSLDMLHSRVEHALHRLGVVAVQGYTEQPRHRA